MSNEVPIRETAEPTATGISNNWLAVLGFIAVEAMLFVTLIFAFGYLRVQGVGWQPQGELIFPTLNLVILLASAVVAYRAERCIRRYRITWAERRLLAASALGILFLVGQVREYAVLFTQGVTLSNSLYGALFYLAIGFHGLHVLSGVIWLLVVWYLTREARQTPANHFAVQAAVVYWSFVAVVWIGLYLLLYIV